MHIIIRACFLCFFYNPYMSHFNSKNFSFTCLHSFLLVQNKLHVYYSSANQKLNFLTYGENTIRRPMYTVYCLPLYVPVLTAVQILALRMFSHAILPHNTQYRFLPLECSHMQSHAILGQAAVATRFRPRSCGATQRARWRCSAKLRRLAGSGII